MRASGKRFTVVRGMWPFALGVAISFQEDGSERQPTVVSLSKAHVHVLNQNLHPLSHDVFIFTQWMFWARGCALCFLVTVTESSHPFCEAVTRVMYALSIRMGLTESRSWTCAVCAVYSCRMFCYYPEYSLISCPFECRRGPLTCLG